MPLPTIPSGNVFSSLPTGYEVANSCRFTRGDSPYMHITPGGDGNLKIFTVSFWVKRGNANAGSSGTDRQVIFSNNTNDQISFHNDTLQFLEDGSNSAITNMKFLDFSAWYHVVMAFDTSQVTNTNRQKVYVNGKQIDQSTGFSTMSYVGQDLEMGFGKGSEKMSVGRSDYDGNRHFDGYLAEFYYINGSMLDHTSFGEFDEDSPTIWKPKEFEGSFGTNGFYLDFEDSANLGNDANGGTDLTEVNLAAADQATDTPTNNFCTLNPLVMPTSTLPVITNGNTNLVSQNASSKYFGGCGTFGLTAGKWYWEVKLTDINSAGSLIGISDRPEELARNNYDLAYFMAYGYGIKDGDGNIRNNTSGSQVDSSYGVSYTDNDIIGVHLDLDNNKLYYAKNGTLMNSGTGFTTTAVTNTNSGFWFPTITDTGTNAATWQVNFGGSSGFSISSAASDANGYGNFEYSPSGTFDSATKNFLAICTKNLGSDGG